MKSTAQETLDTNIIVGNIPPPVLEAARHFNLQPADIWGVYLAPNDPRNPRQGEHYLGLTTRTPEQMAATLRNEVTQLDDNSPLQKAFSEQLATSSNLSEVDMRRFIRSGLDIISTHELKHKNQNDISGYQSTILRASQAMRAYMQTPDTGREGRVREIRTAYQDLVLLAEVQALSQQCSLETDMSKEFCIYWFSKTFKLFNDVMENPSGQISLMEVLYGNLRSGSEFDPRASNVYGLLSRALYVTDNPAEVLKMVRAGQLEYADFAKLVSDGLDSVMQATPAEIAGRGQRLADSIDEPFLSAANTLGELL